MRIATPDLVTNSYFPALAAEELGLYREAGLDAHVELLPSLEAVNALRDGAVDFVAFYDPRISDQAVAAMNGFARSLDLLDAPAGYEDVVATRFRGLWTV